MNTMTAAERRNWLIDRINAVSIFPTDMDDRRKAHAIALAIEIYIIRLVESARKVHAPKHFEQKRIGELIAVAGGEPAARFMNWMNAHKID